MIADSRQAQEYFNNHYTTNNPRLSQIMASCTDQISSARRDAQWFFDQQKEGLAKEERKLAFEYEEREKHHRKDMAGIKDK